MEQTVTTNDEWQCVCGTWNDVVRQVCRSCDRYAATSAPQRSVAKLGGTPIGILNQYDELSVDLD